jgi:hypothetical protein
MAGSSAVSGTDRDRRPVTDPQGRLKWPASSNVTRSELAAGPVRRVGLLVGEWVDRAPTQGCEECAAQGAGACGRRVSLLSAMLSGSAGTGAGCLARARRAGVAFGFW